MRLIPVTLKMDNIEPDSWTTITFSTPNVEWSIGDQGRDGFGFSCGGADLLTTEESRFRSLEIIGPSLVLRTTSDFRLAPFLLTMSVSVPDRVEMLEAHCNMCDDARIYVEFENFKPQLWKSGRVCAYIPPVVNGIKKVTLRVNGARSGELLRVSLASECDDQSMYWSFGPRTIFRDSSSETANLLQSVAVLGGEKVPIPLYAIKISASVIEVQLVGATNGWGNALPDALAVESYVLCRPGDTGRKGRLLLKVDCDDDVFVTAQCGYQRPQYLTSVYKPFEF